MWVFKNILGIDHKINGNFPDYPCIIASNHESSWDNAFFFRELKNPILFMKKQYLSIPFFSDVAKKNRNYWSRS